MHGTISIFLSLLYSMCSIWDKVPYAAKIMCILFLGGILLISINTICSNVLFKHISLLVFFFFGLVDQFVMVGYWSPSLYLYLCLSGLLYLVDLFYEVAFSTVQWVHIYNCYLFLLYYFLNQYVVTSFACFVQFGWKSTILNTG